MRFLAVCSSLLGDETPSLTGAQFRLCNLHKILRMAYLSQRWWFDLKEKNTLAFRKIRI